MRVWFRLKDRRIRVKKIETEVKDITKKWQGLCNASSNKFYTMTQEFVETILFLAPLNKSKVKENL